MDSMLNQIASQIPLSPRPKTPSICSSAAISAFVISPEWPSSWRTRKAPPEEIVQAAAAVHRYYSVSLPLHEADEDQTLRPRLGDWPTSKFVTR